MAIDRFEKLRMYQQAFEAAMEIFKTSSKWTKEERCALTDQVRRSSRSVCANIAEVWRKRRYRKHFISRLSDADAEAAETRTWLRFAHRYPADSDFETLDQTYDRICGGLVLMIQEPGKWCGSSGSIREFASEYHHDP